MQTVLVLSDGDESDPVSDLVLLQVSLGQVLQVLTGELGVRDNNDLVSLLGDGDVGTQVTNVTTDLDVVNQVLSVRGRVENTLLSWSGSVDGESLSLVVNLLGLIGC